MLLINGCITNKEVSWGYTKVHMFNWTIPHQQLFNEVHFKSFFPVHTMERNTSMYHTFILHYYIDATVSHPKFKILVIWVSGMHLNTISIFLINLEWLQAVLVACIWWFLAWLPIPPWWWMRYVPPKRLALSELYSVTTQKTVLLTVKNLSPK
jgi:hypothetical protein